MKPTLSVLLLLWTLAATVDAQSLLPRAALFQEKDIYQVTLSPTGGRLYYQKRSARDGRVFYRPTDRPNQVHSVAFGGAVLDWVAVPQGLLAVVKMADRAPLLMLAEGEGQIRTFPFVPFRLMRFKASSRTKPAWVAAEVFTQNPDQQGLYRLDCQRLEWKRMGPLLDYQSLFFDGQLRPRAARHPNAEGGYSIFRYDGQQWVETKRYPFDESQFSGGFQQVLSVSSDGRYMYCTDNQARDKTVLVQIDTRSGATTLLLADSKADLLPFSAILSPDGKPQMVQSRFGRVRRHFLDAAAQQDFEYANQLLQGQARFVQSTADNRQWLLMRQDGGPGRYYLFKRDNRQLTRLLDLIPDLQRYAWSTPTTHAVITRDGYELPVQVYLPAGASRGQLEQPLPTVVYVHGGPWEGLSHWEEWTYRRHFQLLVDRGYAVINAEFRGSTGRGKHMVDLGDGAWGREMHYDIADITRWAVDQGIADQNRLAIWGWSYGGYAAAAALAFSPDLFRCGLAMYGPMDLERYAQSPFAQNSLWQKRVGDVNTPEGRAALRQQSPAHRIAAIQRPLLLTIGGRDGRIPLSQIADFAEQLYRAGKPVTYLYFPEETHDYQRAESWTAFWAVAEQFLHRKLGGRYEPAGTALRNTNASIIYGDTALD